MGDWTFDAGDVLVKDRDERAGILKCDKKGWRIIFGSSHLKKEDGTNDYPRIDMTQQSHGMFDQQDPTVGCFIAAADLIQAELDTHKVVIINCANGNSRTGHALIAFLVRHAGLDLEAAEKLVVEAQAHRGKKEFDPRQSKSQHNYLAWMVASEARIKDKGNSVAQPWDVL